MEDGKCILGKEKYPELQCRLYILNIVLNWNYFLNIQNTPVVCFPEWELGFIFRYTEVCTQCDQI